MTHAPDMPHAPPEKSTWSKYRARLSIVLRSDFLILAGLAAVLGAAVGYMAVGFRLAIRQVQKLGFNSASEAVFLDLSHLPWWQVVLAPTVGGLVVGFMTRFLLAGRRSYGVPEVIEGTAIRSHRLTLPQGILGIIASTLALGSGASAGREGPIVHLGATLAAWLGGLLHLPTHLIRTLLGCGTAAAVAASFNAPIAGVFFALEVVIGQYTVSAFAPIVLAAVAGTMVSRVYLGNFPAFVIPAYDLDPLRGVGAFILLGLLAAITAILFVRCWQGSERLFRRVDPPLVLRPAIAGLAVGIIAIWLPQILSVGYAATDAALNAQFSLQMTLLLLAVKIIATAICLAGRFGVGVFSAALFVGAMLGSAFGLVITGYFPAIGSHPGLYAIVGMGAVAAAVLGAPISTTLIVFELTADYQITLVMMVAVAIAAVITRAVVGTSFFHLQLLERGVDVRGGRAEQLIRLARVGQAMRDDCRSVTESARIGALPKGQTAFPVVDGSGSVVGIIARSELPHSPPPDAKAEDFATNPGALEARDSLQKALALFEETGATALPVITDAETRKPAGVLYERDALRAYNNLLLDARLEETGRIARHKP